MTTGFRIAITGDIDDGLEDLDSCLRPLCETLNSSHVRMTIPIVARAVESSPRSVSYLAEHGVEVSGHGDVHAAFTGPIETQRLRLREMNRTFSRILGITPLGFRAPFLAHDKNLYSALSLEGFGYDSSRTSIDLLMRMRRLLSRRSIGYRDSLAKTLKIIVRRLSNGPSARPFFVAPKVVELPVFEMDDWFFFEYEKGPRLAQSELRSVSDIWMAAARHLSGGDCVLVVQAHPKRISPKRLQLLEDFVGRAKAEGYRFSTLSELAKIYGSSASRSSIPAPAESRGLEKQ